MYRTAPLLPLFVALVTLAPAQAQAFTIHGEVERTATGFQLADVDIPLKGGLSVSSFVGEIVEIYGTNTGTNAKPVIKVSSVKESEDTFESKGDPSIGDELRLKLRSKSGKRYYFFLSFKRGFIPTDNRFPGANLRGTFFLDINSFFLIGPGAFSGSWEERIHVPRVQSLVGLRVWAQAAATFKNNSAVYVNAVSVVIRS